jgi:hypothetical protein
MPAGGRAAANVNINGSEAAWRLVQSRGRGPPPNPQSAAIFKVSQIITARPEIPHSQAISIKF